MKALVAETEIVVTNTREDNLTEIVERYPTVRRMIPVLLNAFVFRSWKPNDSLLDALDLLRGLYAAGPRQLPQRPPTAFLKATWRKLVGRGSIFDRRAYEVAVMMTLRDSLRSGDIWERGTETEQTRFLEIREFWRAVCANGSCWVLRGQMLHKGTKTFVVIPTEGFEHSVFFPNEHRCPKMLPVLRENLAHDLSFFDDARIQLNLLAILL